MSRAPATIDSLGGASSVGRRVVLWANELDAEVTGTITAHDLQLDSWTVRLDDYPDRQLITLSQGPFTSSGSFRVIRYLEPRQPAEAGFAAGWAGAPRQCPHHLGTPERTAWLVAYDYAQRKNTEAREACQESGVAAALLQALRNS